MTTALLGLAVIAGGIALLAFLFWARVVLACIGLAAVLVGVVAFAGLVVQGDTTTNWPAYALLGGFALALPAIIAGE